ncbi:MAG: hypothetical protein KDE48_03555 [Anaerolineales bacterium]|nr:hypothetical protein [Anaerolineales bacterium]
MEKFRVDMINTVKKHILVWVLSVIFCLSACSPENVAPAPVTVTEESTVTIPALKAIVTETSAPSTVSVATVVPAETTGTPIVITTPTPIADVVTTQLPTEIPKPTLGGMQPDFGTEFFFFMTTEPKCESGGSAPNYGLYRVYQEEGIWQNELLLDGFYMLKSTLSPDKKQLAILSAIDTHESSGDTPCSSYPNPRINQLQIYDREEKALRGDGLTLPGEFSSSNAPVWSHDSRFIYERVDENTLAQIDAQTFEQTELANLPWGIDWLIEVSSIGTVAVAISGTQQPDFKSVFLIDANTREIIPYSFTGFSDNDWFVRLAWSPNGELLALTSTVNVNNLTVVNADGVEQFTTNNISTGNTNFSTLLWSPDSDLLAYLDENEDLVAWSPNDQDVQFLMHAPAGSNKKENWSDDGTLLLQQDFSPVHEERGVRILNINTGDVRVAGKNHATLATPYGWLGEGNQFVVVLKPVPEETTQPENNVAEKPMNTIILSLLDIEEDILYPVFAFPQGSRWEVPFWVALEE